MKTIDIKGKKYVQVNERLKWFRENVDGYGLITEIIQLDENSCTMQAKIVSKDGFVVAMGTAHEERDDKASMVNKTSYVENCETSAWGRALGNFGIGIDESIATADEVLRAIAKQDQIAQNEDKQVKTAQPTAERESLTLEKALQFKTTKGKFYSELTDDNLKYIIDNSKDDLSIEAATLILEDRQMCEDLQPIPVGEEGLPF